MAATIGDLCKIELPKDSRFDRFVGSIVIITPYNEETDKIEYGRLLSTKNGICKFERRDRTTFKIDEADIKDIHLFRSKNYNGGK